MQPGIDTPEYWIESFKPSDADLTVLYERVVEAMRPFDIEALAEIVVRHRVDKVLEAHRVPERTDGVVYQPTNRYDVGQKLVFPALQGLEGVVSTVRPGNNPTYGAYEVVGVKISGGQREFAAGLTWEHALSHVVADLDPDILVERYAPVIAPQLAARLSRDSEWLCYGDRWFVRAFLPEVNAGHRNLAEAIIMLAGEPVPAEQLLRDVEIDESVPLDTRALALELALVADPRFRNVGALESPLWTLSSQA